MSVYRSERPRLVRQLASVRARIQLIAKIERARLTWLRIAGLEIVTERVVAAGRKVAEDLQAVAARRELRAQARLVRWTRASVPPPPESNARRLPAASNRLIVAAKSPLAALTLTVPASDSGEIVVVVIRLIAAAGDGPEATGGRDGVVVGVRSARVFATGRFHCRPSGSY